MIEYKVPINLNYYEEELYRSFEIVTPYVKGGINIPKDIIKLKYKDKIKKQLGKKVKVTAFNIAKAFGEEVLSYIRKKMRQKKTGKKYYIPTNSERTTTTTSRRGVKNYISHKKLRENSNYFNDHISQNKFTNDSYEQMSPKFKKYIAKRDKSYGIKKQYKYNRYKVKRRAYTASRWDSTTHEYPAIVTGYLYRGLYFTIENDKLNNSYKVVFMIEPKYALYLLESKRPNGRPFLQDAVKKCREKYNIN